MLSPAQFLAGWPEFRKIEPPYVAACLMRAASRMGGPDYTVWGQPTTPTTPPVAPAPLTIVDSAQGCLAAHYLITGPYGTSTGLKVVGGKSEYLKQFEDYELAVAGGFLVASHVV